MNNVDPSVLLVALLCAAVVLVVCIVMGRRIEAKIGMVHFELNPNGGKTMRDAINRIERRITLVADRVTSVEHALKMDSDK